MLDDSMLVLSGIGVPSYSARGLTQTLQPIEAAGSQRRTVNGTLVDLSQAQFRKYRSTIRCSDQQAPALDDVWPGKVVTVSCIAELCCPSTDTPAKTCGVRLAANGGQLHLLSPAAHHAGGGVDDGEG